MKYNNDITIKLNIPIFIKEWQLNKPLIIECDNNGNLTAILYNNGEEKINLLTLINENAKFSRTSLTLDKHYKFYYMSTGIAYILAVKIIDSDHIHKIRFTLNGSYISQVHDRVIGNSIYRSSNNKTTEFENNHIIKIEQKLQLKPIKSLSNKVSYVTNPNIGVIDTETYLDSNGLQKVYSLGFKTNLEDNPITFYLDDKGLDSNYLITLLIDELLKPKYNGHTFYCHNLGGYDIVFILNTLYDYNNISKSWDAYPYIIESTLRDDKILKITITKKVNNKIRKLVLVDSYAMLNTSLKALCVSFETNVVKGIFPYKFALLANLFYKGDKPDIKFYNDISIEDYNLIPNNNWYFKQETIRYLYSDLNSLYEVLTKANKQVFNDYNVNMIDSITISGLSLKIFFKDYYKSNIPQINKASIYNDIKKAYYGGITEVYKPSNLDTLEKLYYYDVNSLYPFAALNDMPGLNSKKFYYLHGVNLADIPEGNFGFYYCEIETPLTDYIGLLPVRSVNGLTFPLGKYSGWYFSEELKFAMSKGYKVRVLNGYYFDKVKDVFKYYIESIYKIKSNPSNPVQKQIAKSLLNNLLGRFGISLDKPITKIVSENKFNEISLINKITSYKIISEDKILLTYIPKLDPQTIESYNLDIIKVLDKYKDSEIQSLNVSSVVISAAVNSYARIHMQELKLYILSNGGTLYYSDTDSIVTNLKLDEALVDKNELGLKKKKKKN